MPAPNGINTLYLRFKSSDFDELKVEVPWDEGAGYYAYNTPIPIFNCTGTPGFWYLWVHNQTIDESWVIQWGMGGNWTYCTECDEGNLYSSGDYSDDSAPCCFCFTGWGSGSASTVNGEPWTGVVNCETDVISQRWVTYTYTITDDPGYGEATVNLQNITNGEDDCCSDADGLYYLTQSSCDCWDGNVAYGYGYVDDDATGCEVYGIGLTYVFSTSDRANPIEWYLSITLQNGSYAYYINEQLVDSSGDGCRWPTWFNGTPPEDFGWVMTYGITVGGQADINSSADRDATVSRAANPDAATITDAYDFNRDKAVDSSDVTICENNNEASLIIFTAPSEPTLGYQGILVAGEAIETFDDVVMFSRRIPGSPRIGSRTCRA